MCVLETQPFQVGDDVLLLGIVQPPHDPEASQTVGTVGHGGQILLDAVEEV